MAKFNPHSNLKIYRWNSETQKDGEYVGRVSEDGKRFIPAKKCRDKQICLKVKADLKQQHLFIP